MSFRFLIACRTGLLMPMRLPLLVLLAAFGFRLCAGDWQSLFDGRSLAGWETTAFAGRGDIEVTNGVITLNQGILTGIHRTNPPAKVDYEIELEARRVLGGDFFCGLTFPFQDTFATLVVGGWGGAVVGISSLDGLDASHNETSRYVSFKQERWYRIRLSVTTTNLSAWIDDERVVNVDPRGRKVALRPGDIELSAPLGIASWSTTAELRQLRWRSLADGVPPTPSAPPKPTSPTSPAPPAPAPASPDSAGTPAAVADRITAAALGTDRAWRRLAELCDRFGPRFSGTTNLEFALDWILSEMKSDGLEQVHGEPVRVPRWIRGKASLELRSPTPDSLPLLALGGSVGTPTRGLTSSVLVVTNFDELKARQGEAKGRIVLFDVPFTQYGESVRYRWGGASAAARAGAVGALVRSVGLTGLRTPHTGGMEYEAGVPKIPIAAISAEDAERLHRWQDRGVRPTVNLNLGCRSAGEAHSRNVVAEWRGRTHPEEIVVVGGHVDSWDVGRGALDDGGGCLAAWEAVRLLKELGLRPRRTIRVVLWTNEENGLRGARAYRDTHRAELPRHVLAIESDNGAFAPEGFGFTGSDAGMAVLREVVGLTGPRLGAGKLTAGGQDADTGPLLQEGVPVAALRVAGRPYFLYHHTDADTPDKVDPKALAQCTAALAILTYHVADREAGLPR